jgi:hypothetical protein
MYVLRQRHVVVGIVGIVVDVFLLYLQRCCAIRKKERLKESLFSHE